MAATTTALDVCGGLEGYFGKKTMLHWTHHSSASAIFKWIFKSDYRNN